jgi:hypothetical protein
MPILAFVRYYFSAYAEETERIEYFLGGYCVLSLSHTCESFV